MKHPPRAAPRLPNEILLPIFESIGAESTRDFEPLTLVNQHWHEVAASLLLATISISSLHGILDLCSLTNPEPTARCTGGARLSSILKYAQTIVLSGETLYNITDLEGQLLGFPDSYGNHGKEKKALRNLGISQSPQDISRVIQGTLPHLVSLERLEWYGRFPGDYYFVAQLQQARIIRSLVYGVDSQGYNELPISYCKHAFSFTNLRSVEVVFNWPDGRGRPIEMFSMLRRNSELQRILYDIQDTEPRTPNWHISELVTGSPLQYGQDIQLFVWPKLQSLDLEISQPVFWEDPKGVELFTMFLVAHPTLEELILREKESDKLELTTKKGYPFSLAPYPKALPHLKRLLAPECFLPCILESHAACMSVQIVTDNSIALYQGDLWPDAQITCNERVLECFKNVPRSELTKLNLGVSRLNRDMFVKLAQSAPGIRILDLFQRSMFARNWVAWDTRVKDEDEYARPDAILSWLEMFPNLDIIGRDIAAAYIELFKDKKEAMIDLGYQLPGLKGIQIFSYGVQLHYVRTSDESLNIEIGQECPENFRLRPQQGAFSDWVHRPAPSRVKRAKWISQTKANSRKPTNYF